MKFVKINLNYSTLFNRVLRLGPLYTLDYLELEQLSLDRSAPAVRRWEACARSAVQARGDQGPRPSAQAVVAVIGYELSGPNKE